MPWRKYGTATAAERAPTDTCRGKPPQAMDTGCTDARPPRHSSLRNILTTKTLQKTVFRALKGNLLQDKRLPFTIQKVIIWKHHGCRPTRTRFCLHERHANQNRKNYDLMEDISIKLIIFANININTNKLA